MKFHKYHGLGNDYIVLDPAEVGGRLSCEQIRLLCHRNYGVGGDGILFGPSAKDGYEYGLRIFNPDGSEAEKSGNSLQIFSRYLYDKELVGEKQFEILTKGGLVRCQVHDGGKSVTIEMGSASVGVCDGIAVLDKTFKYCEASIGKLLQAILAEIGPERQMLFMHTHRDSRQPVNELFDPIGFGEELARYEPLGYLGLE